MISFPSEDGKDLYEHLEVLFRHIEGTNAEASFDVVINELVRSRPYAITVVLRFWRVYRRLKTE